MMSSANDRERSARRLQRVDAEFKRVVFAVAFAFVIATSFTAHADDDTDSFVVSARVVATCEVSASDLDFGDYNPVTPSHLEAATTLALTCTNGTDYEIGLSLGDNTASGASMATRYMDDNNSNLLGYTLYQNAGHTTLWGPTTNRLSGSGTGSSEIIDIFGRVQMNQTAPAGNYSDTIVVTVTW